MTSRIPRRTFCAAAGLALLPLSVPMRLLAADAKPGRFGKWPIGIQSYTLRKFDLVQTVRHLEGLGIHHIEYYPGHLPINSTDEQLAEHANLLATANIKMTAHGVNGFSADQERNRQIFQFAKKAGIKNLTADPTPDSFDSLDKLVAEFDVRISIHNHGPGARYDTIDSCVAAVEGHDPRIGVCVDTGHFIRSKEDPIEAIERLGKRVFGVHIKDEAKQEKRSHNVVIGTGFLDLVKLFQTLDKVDFPQDGAISLEYEANPDNPIDDVQQCLVAAEEAIATAG